MCLYLVDAIIAPVRHKHADLRVAQQIVLRQPGGNLPAHGFRVQDLGFIPCRLGDTDEDETIPPQRLQPTFTWEPTGKSLTPLPGGTSPGASFQMAQNSDRLFSDAAISPSSSAAAEHNRV